MNKTDASNSLLWAMKYLVGAAPDQPRPEYWKLMVLACRTVAALAVVLASALITAIIRETLLSALLSAVAAAAILRMLEVRGPMGGAYVTAKLLTPTGNASFDSQRTLIVYIAALIVRPAAVFFFCLGGFKTAMLPVLILSTSALLETDAPENPATGKTLLPTSSRHWLSVGCAWGLAFLSALFCAMAQSSIKPVPCSILLMAAAYFLPLLLRKRIADIPLFRQAPPVARAWAMFSADSAMFIIGLVLFSL